MDTDVRAPLPATPSVRPGDPVGRGGWARLTVTAAASVAVTAALVARLAAVLPAWLGPTAPRAEAALRTARVEDLVEVAALATGVVVGLWVVVSVAAAATCAAVRSAGRRWAAGERFVARTAPAVVRRALALTAGTGVALATAGLPAVAGTPAPPTDLGWSPTVTAEVRAEPSATPAASAPATAPSAVAAGTDGAAGPGTAGPGVGEPAGPGGRTEPAAPGAPPVSAPDIPTAAPAAAVAAPVSAPDAPTAAPPAVVSSPLLTPPPAGERAAAPAALRTGEQPSAAQASPGPSTGVAPTSVTTPGSPTPHPVTEAPAPPGSVTVLSGDTLWGIAAEHLPAGATVADVAAAWPAWYAANAATIGTDPGLIVPGQVLRPPPDVTGTSATTGARS
ncbi:LysM domain-containing protein [uncultured Cellulomonas sp.]|uniref:LysM domain-containing protein n=1 Tax=uncultured Cellulomonas sp. TaxID=189682 RepID=UPI002636CF98|nr:LysM domain-containing protein [uncultured Cellulomonas sp.]